MILLTMAPGVLRSGYKGGEIVGGVGCYLIKVHGFEGTKPSGFPPNFQELPVHSFGQRVGAESQTVLTYFLA